MNMYFVTTQWRGGVCMSTTKPKVSPAKKTKVPLTPVNALTSFALQILLDSDLSLDTCRVVVASIRVR